MRRFIILGLIFLNLAAIFCFSHQSAETSRAISDGISRQIEVRTFGYEQKNQGEKNVLHALMQSGLRKAAHAILFFPLGILLVLFSKSCCMRWYWGSFVSLGFCFFAALGDEWHQTFVPGRTFEWRDILFDSYGFLSGVFLMGLILLIRVIIRRKVNNI